MRKIQVTGSEQSFHVGKVLCIGRNYAKHAAEMGGVVPTEPWVFLKPSSAIVRSGEEILLPSRSRDIHHEVELVALIGRQAKDISADEALHYVVGYAAGLDMTARDLQSAAKDARAPWSVSKGFDTFAPLGPIVPATDVSDPQSLNIRLFVNGEIRQDGSTHDMIFSVAQLVAYCSSCFTLEPGDLLYTGTPEGVGPVHDGDELTAEISGLPNLVMRVSS